MNPPQNSFNHEIEIRDQSGDPFTAVWNWMLDRSDLSGTEKLVWIALKSYAGCREIRPSVHSLSRRAGVSIRTAQRSIEVLSKKGLLRVERRSRPDGGDATNRYILLRHSSGTGIEGAGATVTPAPRCHGDTPPGDNMSPPGVSQCHPKENIKLIKNNTTTHFTPQKPGSGPEGSTPRTLAQSETADSSETAGPVVVVDEITKLINGTPFQKLNEQQLRMFAKKYGARRLFDSLDMLIATFRRSGKTVKDPVAVLVKGLFEGVTPPLDYVPYHLRLENGRKAEEAAERKRIGAAQKKKAEEEAYDRMAAEFDALPEQEKETWVDQAKATMSPAIRDFKYAIRSKAIELFRGG